MTSPTSKNVKFTVVPTDVKALSRENGDTLQGKDDTGMKWVLRLFPVTSSPRQGLQFITTYQSSLHQSSLL